MLLSVRTAANKPLRLFVRAAQACSCIFLRHACSAEWLRCVGEMPVRKFPLVIIVKTADGRPVLGIFAEMFRHGFHAGGDVGCVELPVLFGYTGIVEAFGLIQDQFIQCRASLF